MCRDRFSCFGTLVTTATGCKYLPEQVKASRSQVAHLLPTITSVLHLVLTDLLAVERDRLPVYYSRPRRRERVLVTDNNYMLVVTTGKLPSGLDVIDR